MGNPNEFRHIEDLFNQVLDLEPSSRPAFLDKRCGTDLNLRRKLESLLELNETDGAAFDPPVGLVDSSLPSTDDDADLGHPESGFPPGVSEGQSIGPYRVARVIGSGGMGTVLAAHQTNPNRTVALKLLRAEMLSKSLIGRFDLETEILGQLQHPGIAQIYDGGTTTILGTEVPYFAMEFVPSAVSIVEYVESRSLSAPAILRLFIEVCDAVSHAHNRGVVHRDLKSDNILLSSEDDRLQPKVIDFGIARTAATDLGTALTSAGQIVGTLAAMSPEQARGDSDAIDVRTDVYGLGVVLYQALTGQLPIPLSGLPVHTAIERILTQTPQKPSEHRKALRGDLDAILMMSLCKEPERRYESAQAFKRDIAAFLEHRPVAARAPSAIYQARVLVRRHRAVAASLLIVFIVAIASAIVSARFAMIATQRAEDATRQAYRANMNAAAKAIEDNLFIPASFLLEDTAPELRGWEWDHLSSRLDAGLATFSGYSAELTDFVLLPDGNHYATAARDSSIRIWNADTGAQSIEISVGGLPITAIFDPESNAVVSAVLRDGDSFVGSWNVDTGQLLHRWPTGALFDETTTGRLVLSPKPPWRLLRGTSFDGRVPGIALDLESGETMAQNESLGHFVFWSPDGRSFGTNVRHSDGRFLVRIFEWPERATWRDLTGPQDQVGAIAFSEDGQYVAAGGGDYNVWIWSLTSDDDQPQVVLEGHTAQVTSVAFSSDSKTVFSSSLDRTARAWDLETGLAYTVCGGLDRGIVGVAVDAQRNRLYTAENAGTVRVWDLAPSNLRVLRGHESYVYPVVLSDARGMILSGGWDGYLGKPGCVRWWDLDTGAPIAAQGKPDEIAVSMCLSPDETMALSTVLHLGATGETTSLWSFDLTTGRSTRRVPKSRLGQAIATDPSFERIAVGYKGIEIRDRKSYELLHSVDADVQNEVLDIVRVAWSTDGKWIAAVLGHDHIQIWDAETYEVVGSAKGHDDTVFSVEFDPNSKRLITASDDQTFRVWTVPELEPVSAPVGHGNGVLCARFSPDGKRIASGGRDGRIRLWTTDTFEQVVSLGGHESYVYDLAWSGDGRRLVSSSGDGTVRIWETSPLRERLEAIAGRSQILGRMEERIAAFKKTLQAGGSPDKSVLEDASLSARERQVLSQEMLRVEVASHETKE